MSVLTKNDRLLWRLDAERGDIATLRQWSCEEMLIALNTIDALEASLAAATRARDTCRDQTREIKTALKAFLGMPLEHEWALEDGVKLLISQLDAIRAYALERRQSRGIGDHARALDKIAEMAGGGE